MKQQSTAKVLHKPFRKGLLKREQQGVQITSDAGQVDVDDVDISKGRGDEVTWFAHGSVRATIEFSSTDGSPFQDSTFQVPAGGSVSTGPARANAVVGKYYKYTVKGPKGRNDPGVIIHN